MSYFEQYYDENYEKLRNAQIPAAEKYANKKTGKKPPAGAVIALKTYRREWNLFFHTKMNQLVAETSNERGTT